MSHDWSALGSFFKNPDFDYETRIIVGASSQGVGDIGLVLATLDKITDGDAQSWFDNWTALAADLAAHGDAAVKAGHLATARWALQSACEYYSKALVFIDSLADQSVLLPTFAEHRACWEKIIDNSAGKFVRLPVPYEGGAMPGYLLRPDASGAKRPTLVMTNGSDGSLPSMLSYGGSQALERGWNVFAYDGPGQQSMLFERNIPFRYDWEKVLTPVIDTLLTRPEVDGSALLGYAISQGGYWIARAVAFEHRLLAAVADPGAIDIFAGWAANMPAQLIHLLDTSDKATFDKVIAGRAATPEQQRTLAFRGKPYGTSDPYDLLTTVRTFQARDVAGQVTTPMLILDPDDEQFFPGQAQQLYDALPGEKQIIHFTADQGANWHCQPLGRQLTHTQMLDWLADHLPAQDS